MAAGRRRFLASLFVALAWAGLAAAVCDDWQASGMECMACCAHEDRPCSRVAAGVCGTVEQRRYATAAAAMPELASPRLLCALALPVLPEPDLRESLVGRPSAHVLGSPPHTHLLLSVFLI